MLKREGRWVDVHPGNYVKDLNGKTWRVERWSGSTAKLRASDGSQATAHPDPYSKVTILSISMEDAVSVVADKLGGVVIEEHNERTTA